VGVVPIECNSVQGGRAKATVCKQWGEWSGVVKGE
jgi:hypothetical protein